MKNPAYFLTVFWLCAVAVVLLDIYVHIPQKIVRYREVTATLLVNGIERPFTPCLFTAIKTACEDNERTIKIKAGDKVEIKMVAEESNSIALPIPFDGSISNPKVKLP